MTHFYIDCGIMLMKTPQITWCKKGPHAKHRKCGLHFSKQERGARCCPGHCMECVGSMNLDMVGTCRCRHPGTLNIFGLGDLSPKEVACAPPASWLVRATAESKEDMPKSPLDL